MLLLIIAAAVAVASDCKEGGEPTWLGGRSKGFSERPIEGTGILGSVSHDGNMSKALPIQRLPATHPTRQEVMYWVSQLELSAEQITILGSVKQEKHCP